MFDAFTRLQQCFDHLAEMKIKKPQVIGVVCRKLAKYLLREYDSEVVGDKISLEKEEMKVQILENIGNIIEKARNHIRKSGE